MYLKLDLFIKLSVILFAVWPVAARAQVGLGLSPMRTELRLEAGARHSGSLTLSNDSAAPSRAVAELLDFSIDATATPQFGRNLPDEAGFSCRQWLVINPMESELEPTGQVTIRYSIRVPAGMPARGYHCAVGFSTLPGSGELAGTGIRTAVRVIGAFYVIVGNPTLDGIVKSMRIEPVPGAPSPAWRAAVVFENRGETHFRPTGKLELSDLTGTVLHTADFVPMPVLPRREQVFLFPLNVQPGGDYIMRARVDLGANEIQEVTTRVAAGNSN